MRVLAIVAFVFAYAAPVRAQSGYENTFNSGNQFVRTCEASVTNKTLCLTYVMGVYHGSQSTQRTVCLPQGVDNGQLYEVVIAYIRNNPARAHLVPFGLMLDSWRAAFPCR